MLARGIGIRFKGVEKDNVEEYCVSEGWVRLSVGKTLDRHGNPLTMKVNWPGRGVFPQLMQALLGIACLLLLAWAISENRRSHSVADGGRRHCACNGCWRSCCCIPLSRGPESWC